MRNPFERLSSRPSARGERRVRIKAEGGMREFWGKTGTARWKEDGMWRVFLDEPVEIAGLGRVTDDLWAPAYLTTIRKR